MEDTSFSVHIDVLGCSVVFGINLYIYVFLVGFFSVLKVIKVPVYLCNFQFIYTLMKGKNNLGSGLMNRGDSFQRVVYVNAQCFLGNSKISAYRLQY